MRLFELIPESEAILALEPQELAGYLLEYIHTIDSAATDTRLSRQQFGQPENFRDYPGESRKEVSMAWMEAWAWLEREGFLVPRPDSMGQRWLFLTRRGRKIKNRIDLNACQRSSCLPKELLHPQILQRTWGQFIRGEYDTAVFEAFKEVEIAVRIAAGMSPTDYGTDLMRKAFDKENGPLTNTNAPLAERDALAHLFAGAIGSYKNPHSHRRVEIRASEAAEMIVLASHLIGIVDARSKK